MEIRMKKKFIICGLLVAGILTIVISMYQKDKTSEAEHEEWIKIQYSNQNGAFFNRSAWIDYHNAELLNETKVWVDLYVYNQYVSKEEKIFLEDVKEYLGSILPAILRKTPKNTHIPVTINDLPHFSMSQVPAPVSVLKLL